MRRTVKWLVIGAFPIVGVVLGLGARFIFGRWALAVGICGIVSAPLIWWLIVERARNPGIVRGALAGMLTSIAAYGFPMGWGLLWFYGLRELNNFGEPGMGAIDDFLFNVGLVAGALGSGIINSLLGAIAAKTMPRERTGVTT